MHYQHCIVKYMALWQLQQSSVGSTWPCMLSFALSLLQGGHNKGKSAKVAPAIGAGGGAGVGGGRKAEGAGGGPKAVGAEDEPKVRGAKGGAASSDVQQATNRVPGDMEAGMGRGIGGRQKQVQVWTFDNSLLLRIE